MKEEEWEQKEEGTRSAFHQILKCSTNLFCTLWSFSFPFKMWIKQSCQKTYAFVSNISLIRETESSLRVLTLPEEMEQGVWAFIWNFLEAEVWTLE